MRFTSSRQVSTSSNLRTELDVSVPWGHFVTEFDDGTVIDADLAVGRDGWGFVMLRDESGRFRSTTDVQVRAEVSANGYPSRLHYYFMNEEWMWTIAPDGQRAKSDTSGALLIVGAEGVLTRVGEKRPVVRAMGTIDWWLDGRADAIIHRGAQGK